MRLNTDRWLATFLQYFIYWPFTFHVHIQKLSSNKKPKTQTEERDRGEIHRRRDRGKEIEGNRHRERDRGEQHQGKIQWGTGKRGEREGGGEEEEREGERETEGKIQRGRHRGERHRRRNIQETEGK